VFSRDLAAIFPEVSGLVATDRREALARRHPVLSTRVGTASRQPSTSRPAAFTSPAEADGCLASSVPPVAVSKPPQATNVMARRRRWEVAIRTKPGSQIFLMAINPPVTRVIHS
jgi:hypothetical protein